MVACLRFVLSLGIKSGGKPPLPVGCHEFDSVFSRDYLRFDRIECDVLVGWREGKRGDFGCDAEGGVGEMKDG